MGRSGQTHGVVRRTSMPSPDSALRAGLIRTINPDLRSTVMREISRQLALDPAKRKVEGYLQTADTRGDVRLELEKMAGEGLLERRFTLTCPECGSLHEASYKKPLALDELPLGKEFRCEDCKHVYAAQHSDFYCSYFAPEDFPVMPVDDPRAGRDHKKDQDAVEKAVKRRLRKGELPFLASELADELEIPVEIVRANLAWIVRSGDLDEHDVERCPACGHDICSGKNEIETGRIGCLEVCPACNHGPWVVNEADVVISYDRPGTGDSRRHGYAGSF